jgi:hypothetical protein
MTINFKELVHEWSFEIYCMLFLGQLKGHFLSSLNIPKDNFENN